MIGWNHRVEIERIEKLSLPISPPPHHALPPADALSTNGITDREPSQREFCNTIRSRTDIHRRGLDVRFVPIATDAPQQNRISIRSRDRAA